MNKTAQKNVSLGQYSSWGHKTNSAPLNLRGCWAHPKAANGLLEAAHASALLNIRPVCPGNTFAAHEL